MTSCPTLALFASKLELTYQAPIWRGAAEVAQQRGANLLCFAGGMLYGAPTIPYDQQGNVIYDLVSSESVDGLIVVSSSIGTFLGNAEMTAFCRRYAPLPVVSIGFAIEGVPSIMTDGAPGLRQALLHLIRDHGYRRIGFIGGPEGHPEAQLRYNVYRETLHSEGLTVDPDLVTPGDFQPASPAVYRYLDRLQEFPEAIVAANDAMALTAIQALRTRGLRVPDDIAVVGFDDSADSRYSTPPLTTVRQQIHEIGRCAAHLCLDQVEGKPVPDETILPTAFVRRRSCGCQLQSVANGATGAPPAPMIGDAVHLGVPTTLPYPTLQAAFEEALETGDPAPFLGALERSMELLPGTDAADWQNAISSMRHEWVPRLEEVPSRLVHAEDLWGQARILIGNTVLSAQDAERARHVYLAEAVRATGEALTTTFDIHELMDTLVANLPALDIPGCYVALYEAFDQDATGYREMRTATHTSSQHPFSLPARAHLVLAYEPTIGRWNALQGVEYPTHRILPEAVLAREPYNKLVAPLYFRETQLGFVVFDVGPQQTTIYESLRDQLSSAIRGALLLRELRRAYNEVEQRVERRTAELQREMAEREQVERVRAALYRISEAAHNAQNPDSLYPVIHDIVGELMPADNFYIALHDPHDRLIRFPYYVDQKDPPPPPAPPGRGLTELILRSGEPLLVTPTAFDDLLQSGEIELIGARPLDWLGAPLTVQGEIIGVLVVQTYDPAIRYDEEDRDVLVFVSAQVGTALKRVEAEAERARLLEALQYRNTQLRTAADVSKSALAYLDPQELVREAVHIVKDRFGFYYAGLFLKDEAGKVAVLQAGTGEVGQQMTRQGHRLPIEDTSMVGSCILHSVARIADDVQKERVRFANPQLPDTRSEMALPLISQSQGCIGALTVQSTEAGAFTEEDIAVLQTIADHLAIAIENARLHDEIRQHAVELEARVAERTDELVATNRELASFSYSVSHDLRSPLRSIDGFSQALLEDYSDVLDAAGRDYLERVRNATQRMGHLIDDLLKLSRLTREELHRADVNLSELAAEVIADLRERQPDRKVRVHLQEQLQVVGDARLLRVALDNLLGNAWKFSTHREQTEIAFGMTEMEEQPTFYIRDNGVGFDMAYADKLFGAFQRLHSPDEFEGTGIGLATVQRIIHRHGGRIWAEGHVGTGATFYFTLPQHGEAALG